jgi:hypothetical protein
VRRVRPDDHVRTPSLTLLSHSLRSSQASGGVRLTRCVRLEVVEVALTSRHKEIDVSPLRRLTILAGMTVAIAGALPVGAAGAATPASDPVSALQALSPPTLPSLPSLSSLLGLSCSVNQGLFPGIINLGPTGPLGPLGPYGPLGNTNNNLPCGAAAFNLGPTGPLGPSGPLGSRTGSQ